MKPLSALHDIKYGTSVLYTMHKKPCVFAIFFLKKYSQVGRGLGSFFSVGRTRQRAFQGPLFAFLLYSRLLPKCLLSLTRERITRVISLREEKRSPPSTYEGEKGIKFWESREEEASHILKGRCRWSVGEKVSALW